ncbi:NAD-dependent epimerase/dehydratase family protein [Demequina sp. NBRC 110051]|uniref:NAD-dependent epimerase/dehydratase family protein n=1 Tax=Demequina sp. NBRC 110051 TaxID=1570340 RepID=UPI000A012E66|nr:NAD-dependent epimerase/dehydratase family protein [Demequina sp. NBRC 110051]
MRILLAGATGVIGARLVPLMHEAGHEVVGITRTPSKAALLSAAGATPVVEDVMDAAAMLTVAHEHRPDLIMHQATDLPDRRSALLFKVRGLGRIRTVGTDALVAAARAVDARFIAQSVAFPLPGAAQRAVTYLEDAVDSVGGLSIRYGLFYGPGTWDETAPRSEDRVHIDTAAKVTIDLLDEAPGVIEVRDSGVSRLR